MTMRILLLLSLMIFGVAPASAADTVPSIEVWKSATCKCCGAWVKHRGQAHREVNAADLHARGTEAAGRHRRQACLLPPPRSTAMSSRVMCRGDIKRLVAEHPDAIGLAVPGMPAGSPGMEQGAEFEPYDVLLIKKDGTTETFASH